MFTTSVSIEDCATDKAGILSFNRRGDTGWIGRYIKRASRRTSIAVRVLYGYFQCVAGIFGHEEHAHRTVDVST